MTTPFESRNPVGRPPAGGVGWLLLLLMLLAGGCSKEGKIARHVSRGDELHARGEYDAARLEYLNAIQLDPSNAHAMAQVGHIFFEGGNVLQAGAFIEQAIKLGATDPKLSARLGILLGAANRVDAARELARKTLASDPQSEEAVMLLADLANDDAAAGEFATLTGQLRGQHGAQAVYYAGEAAVRLKRRQVAEAQTLAEQAVAADPQSAVAQFVLAGVHFARTNPAAGQAALARAAELSPVRSTRQIQYVNYLHQSGATNEARAKLDAVIQAAPDFVPARLRKAQWAYAAREFDAVQAELEAVFTRDRINPDARVLEAQLHLARREPARAEELMSELIKQFPNSEQLQYQAALASLANQNPVQAQLRLDRAYELNPNVLEVVLLRGRLYLARGQAGEAIASAQRLIASNATVRPAYQLLGEGLVANGETDRAIAVFRDYERRFTNDPAGPQTIGMLMVRKKQLPEARGAFERALALRPDFLPAVEQLVLLELGATNAPAAIARARQYVERHPEVAEARLLLGQALFAGRQLAVAEQELEQAITLKPVLQSAYLLLAQIYNESDRRDEAIAQLKRLLENQPGDQRALMMLGILHTSAGEARQAADYYEELLKKNASFSPALNNLAYLYSGELKNLDRAYELARRSRELLPEDPRIADTLGWILYLRGEYDQALVYLEESAARLSRVGEVQYHLGVAHYALAHEGPSRAALQLAASLEPGAKWLPEVQERLAVLDADAAPGNAEKLRALEQLAARREDDALLLARLGRAQESAGQLANALKTYQRAAAASPAAAAPVVGMARVTVAKGDLAAGLALARKARDMVKGDPGLLLELGRVAFAARDHTWSYALFQDASPGLTADPQAQFAFAQSAIAVGRFDVAKSALERVLAAANPDRARLQLELIPHCAGALAPLPDPLADRLAALEPGELLADYLKARQLAVTGDPSAGVKALEALLAGYSQFTPAKRSLAALLANQPGGAAAAEKWARAVRETQPNDAEMARVLGVVAVARKDYRYAADMLQEAARTLTNDGELQLLLGQARAQNRQVAEARQAFNKALSLPLTEAQQQQAREQLQQLP